MGVQDPNTLAWIFLALGLATHVSPAKIKDISDVADGLNHAVPTHHEMMGSITWLIRAGLAVKVGRAFSLTGPGRALLDKAHENADTMCQAWKNLENLVRPMIDSRTDGPGRKGE